MPDLYTEAGLDAAVREAYEAGVEVDDDVARAIASAWHGGQSSAFYSFASSGHFDREDLQRELSNIIARRYTVGSAGEDLQLDMLGTYLTSRPKTPEEQAFELGCEHARNAASWAIDGNTTQAHIRALVEMLDEGDPAVFDYLPRMPDLSGEFADDLTPTRLWGEIVGYNAAGGIDNSEDGEQLATLCDAYESGVSETFQSECERILRAALED